MNDIMDIISKSVLLEEEAIKIGDFVLTSGKKSSYPL